jgi:hypothetical protein
VEGVGIAFCIGKDQVCGRRFSLGFQALQLLDHRFRQRNRALLVVLRLKFQTGLAVTRAMLFRKSMSYQATNLVSRFRKLEARKNLIRSASIGVACRSMA